MGTLKEHSLKITEQQYHELPAWSYSVIVRYAKEGFNSLKSLHEPVSPTPEMEFGSLFDSIMTKGKQTLNDYAVVDISVPEAERKAIDYIASKTNENLDNLSREYFTTLCDECKYQPRWGYLARFDHINAYRSYYEIKRCGKKTVSQEDWTDAMEMYSIFRKDEYLKNLFGTKNTKDIEYLYQLKFVQDVLLDSGRKVKVKIMPDLLVVNHKEKTIQPVDLKTSSAPAWQFKDNFVKYRYDIQASLYTDILSLVIDKDPDLQDYKILPYLFSDISRSDKVPVTYLYDPKDISQVNGLSFSSKEKTYQYKGWFALLDEILSYEEQQAKVPSYIKTGEPNDIISILER